MIAILLARFGAQSVAAHQIALNFASMLFMIPLSIATAISVRIGFTIGRQRPTHTHRAAHVGIATALGLALISATVIALFPDSCVAIYTTDKELRDAAAALVIYAAIFQIPDAAQVSCAGALRGFKDTRIPMLLQIFAYWGIALPIGGYLGLVLNWGTRILDRPDLRFEQCRGVTAVAAPCDVAPYNNSKQKRLSWSPGKP